MIDNALPPEPILIQQAGPSFIQRVMWSGPIELAGLAAILLAVILIACAPYLVANRRHLFTLIGFAFCLGMGGYVAYDREHIGLNLSMRDAQSVRNDCEDLLRRRKSDGTKEYLSAAELPQSFTRLGARAARVDSCNVEICLYADGFGGAWGFLYDPKRSYLTAGWPHEIRPTWYRDFYEFRERRE